MAKDKDVDVDMIALQNRVHPSIYYDDVGDSRSRDAFYETKLRYE